MLTTRERLNEILRILNSVEFESIDEIQTKIDEAEAQTLKALYELED